MSPWPEEKFNFRKPREYEWSIWIAVGLVLIAQIAKYIIAFSKQQFPGARVSVFFISLTGWSLLAIVLLLAGIQLVRSGNKSKKGRIIVIAAILLFSAKIANSVVYSYTMSSTVAVGTQMSKEAEVNIPEAMSLPAMSATSRETLGRSLAQIKYIQEGIIMVYVDASGESVVFRPTAEDLTLRDERVALIRAVQYQKMLIVYWSVLFIATAAIGLLRKKQFSGQNEVKRQH